jgi:hypothetical protein
MTEFSWLRRWHVAINPLEKYSVHGVGVHSMGMHDVGMCSMGMLGDYVWILGSVGGLYMWAYKKHNFSLAVKTVTFDAHLRKKFLVLITKSFLNPTLPTHPKRKNCRLIPLENPVRSCETLPLQLKGEITSVVSVCAVHSLSSYWRGKKQESWQQRCKSAEEVGIYRQDQNKD